MKIYKVFASDSWCAFDDIESALEEIHNLIEYGEDEDEVYIRSEEMTQKKFDNLPEFPGW